MEKKCYILVSGYYNSRCTDIEKIYEDVRGIYALNINFGDSELLREDVEPLTLS